jgi:glycosyltransferase involved in cell wall biosynthesis
MINAWMGQFRYTFVAADNDFASLAGLKSGITYETLQVSLPKSSLPNFKALATLRGLLRRVSPDLLVTLNWGGIEMALANCWVPMSSQVHLEEGFGPEENPDRQLSRRFWTRRLALGGKHQVTVVPSRTLLELSRERWRLGRVEWIANGIDCERFARPQKAHSPFRKAPGEVVVGAVGGLRPEKNFQRLIASVAALSGPPEVRLVIAGAGPERARLEQVAKDAGLAERVELLGQVENPEALYPLFDIFAVSSDTEQMPLGLMEAMCAGLPVAATEVGDIPNMLPNESRRFLVKPEGTTSLAGVIDDLRSDANLRSRIGKENQRYALKSFVFSEMASRYAALFRDLCESNGVSPRQG